MSHPSKKRGYEAEVRVLKELRDLGFDDLERTGSLGYKAGAADLEQGRPASDPVLVVALVQPHQPTLYAMDAQSLQALLGTCCCRNDLYIAVQVKRRKSHAAVTWWKELFTWYRDKYRR